MNTCAKCRKAFPRTIGVQFYFGWFQPIHNYTLCPECADEIEKQITGESVSDKASSV